jgi:hypothetical protein
MMMKMMISLGTTTSISFGLGMTMIGEGNRVGRITGGRLVVEMKEIDTRRGEMLGKRDSTIRKTTLTLVNLGIPETQARRMYDEREIKAEVQRPLALGSTLRSR